MCIYNCVVFFACLYICINIFMYMGFYTAFCMNVDIPVRFHVQLDCSLRVQNSCCSFYKPHWEMRGWEI